MRHLPPLNAVRAFEAAARHLSFQRAAAELHVTPSAVSHQVRRLEEFLSVTLFRRGNRKIAMTAAGQVLLGPMSHALDEINAAVARIRPARERSGLTLSVTPTFASEWLVPRLYDFQAAHPDVDVRLKTSIRAPDFASDDADLAICFGRDDWPGLHSHRLMGDEPVVVCSPALTTGDHPLRRPADLRHVTLIHVLPRSGLWASWLTVAGAGDVDAERGPMFPNTTLALEAAETGLGVALASRVLAEPHLSSGSLVVPFEVEYGSESGIYLIYPPEHGRDDALAAFRTWLLAKISHEAADLGRDTWPGADAS